MRYILLIVLLFLFACSEKKVSVTDVQEIKKQVAECMGVTSPLPLVKFEIVEEDYVLCNGKKRKGCFLPPATILIPRHTTANIVKHEFVHFILYTTTGDLDANHTSSYFIDCAGIILED